MVRDEGLDLPAPPYNPDTDPLLEGTPDEVFAKLLALKKDFDASRLREERILSQASNLGELVRAYSFQVEGVRLTMERGKPVTYLSVSSADSGSDLVKGIKFEQSSGVLPRQDIRADFLAVRFVPISVDYHGTSGGSGKFIRVAHFGRDLEDLEEATEITAYYPGRSIPTPIFTRVEESRNKGRFCLDQKSSIISLGDYKEFMPLEN